jgi:glutamine---fructose-6-phosphate transaminase (isomerizing)
MNSIDMNANPYIQDILDQPRALRAGLDGYPYERIESLRYRLQLGEFNRIVLTGMGASYNAAYPAWLMMLKQSIPVVHINSAELLHFGQSMIDNRTLLWVNSQSGRSIEVVRLLENLKGNRPAFQLSMTNYLDSPIAQSADIAVPIYAGEERTVNTKTYINTLALLMLTAEQLLGGDWRNLMDRMRNAADAMQEYLNLWQKKVAELDSNLGDVDQVLILGRGQSMAAVWNGSLIQKEAARCVFEGMNAADFRHGPLELASKRLTVLILEGHPVTSALNRELALEVIRLGGKSIWLAFQQDTDLPTVQLPLVDEDIRPLVEILPMQMISIAMAKRAGLEPGMFHHIGKITLRE